MEKTIRFIKDWALVISMVVGVASYLIYVRIPQLDGMHQLAYQAVSVIQPALLFAMLLLTFCRMDIRTMRLRMWHLWMLLIQCGSFVVIAAAMMLWTCSQGLSDVLQGAMILLICPTATAAPVITRKLGGDVSQITTYTVLINIAAAILIPIFVPYIHPVEGMTTLKASLIILSKVFPLLLLPLVVAILLRHLLPNINRVLTSWKDAPFYLWIVSLSLALAMTTRSIVQSTASLYTEAGLFAVSIACCAVQFWLGWRLGNKSGDRVTAGQSMGQKNTVLAIWMGYTFFSPITAVAGGFYCIWHNLVNSYQLYQQRIKTENENNR